MFIYNPDKMTNYYKATPYNNKTCETDLDKCLASIGQ